MIPQKDFRLHDWCNSIWNVKSCYELTTLK